MHCVEAVLKLQGKKTNFISALTATGTNISSYNFSSNGAAKDIWNFLSNTHTGFSAQKVTEECSSKEVLYSEVGNVLENESANDFRVVWNDGRIEYSPLPSKEFARLDINGVVLNSEDAELWIKPLIDCDLLIQARIYDEEYDFWQNAEDLLHYEAHGRSYDDKKLISNGLPFPLEQEVVDISDNPGRWELKKGYIESVGSTMWIGEAFWDAAGTKKEQVLESNFGHQNFGGAIRISVQETPFCSEFESEAKLQDEIRLVLFG